MTDPRTCMTDLGTCMTDPVICMTNLWRGMTDLGTCMTHPGICMTGPGICMTVYANLRAVNAALGTCIHRSSTSSEKPSPPCRIIVFTRLLYPVMLAGRIRPQHRRPSTCRGVDGGRPVHRSGKTKFLLPRDLDCIAVCAGWPRRCVTHARFGGLRAEERASLIAHDMRRRYSHNVRQQASSTRRQRQLEAEDEPVSPHHTRHSGGGQAV